MTRRRWGDGTSERRAGRRGAGADVRGDAARGLGGAQADGALTRRRQERNRHEETTMADLIDWVHR